MSYNPEETEKYVYMITSATDRLNEIDKTLWQLFKQKYEEYTKQPNKGLGRSGETKWASPSPWSRDDCTKCVQFCIV